MTTTLIEKLSERALEDQYFKDLFKKAELIYTLNIFNIEAVPFTQKEFIDILRFADILSNSSISSNKNLAYKIISLLYDQYNNNEDYMFFSKAVLIRLGNFPALQLIENLNSSSLDSIQIQLPWETIMLKEIKETVQAIPQSDKVFTDAQYKIFKALENSNHFSFSGPTSLGKSFIIESYINHIIEIQGDKDKKNIVILVPTKALINQLSDKLNNQYKNYITLTFPKVPEFYKDKDFGFIMILTPERLISYLADTNNPKIEYLFVDEAQKIIADKDSRSALYYHAIEQAKQKSIKLFFASPNIPNADVFLSLFNKSTQESINVQENTVSQNKYLLDLENQEVSYFSEFENQIVIDNGNNINSNLNYWLNFLGTNKKNLIYANTINDTINFALEFSNTLPDIHDAEIDSLIKEIQQTIHPSYYLIDCLKKGVAYHFGQLPPDIREAIEKIYQSNPNLNYLFCTSTLLEGVNLPAKNIFILNKNKGLSKLNKIDFWNLAGRAGRLTKELSGDIYCVKIPEKSNSWGTHKTDLDIIRTPNIEAVAPLIIEGKKNFYKNIENALLNLEFTNKNASFEEKKTWKHYSNIAVIHHLKHSDSILKSKFIQKNTDALKILNKLERINNVPYEILVQSSSIKYVYQYNLFNSEEILHFNLPNKVDFNSCLVMLEILHYIYNWQIEESGGTNPLIRSQKSLRHLAFLMSEWINGRPLNQMIINKIKYHSEIGTIYINREEIIFEPSNKFHINHLINTLVQDIENKLRFTLKNYFLNYYLISNSKSADDENIENWADYLEYGTIDKKIIELQMLGLDRKNAQYLLANFSPYLKFYNDNLIEIDQNTLLNALLNNSKSKIYNLNLTNFLNQIK